MDGNIRPTRIPERGARLATDVGPRFGMLGRLGRVLRQAVARREAPDAPAEPLVVPAAPRRWSPVLLSFIACVVIPAILGDVYMLFVATDQFVAETRAVVRSAEQESSLDSPNGPSGGSSQKSGSSAMSLSLATPSAYIVTDYIRSRAMVDDLGKTMDLRTIYRRPEADFWSRLERDATAEELVDYWKSMVRTYVDGPSGIVTIRIRAFRRDDALALAQQVVQLSEKLVNEISERARRDAMQFAEQEVKRADARVRAALLELRKYRDEQGLIDPVKTADETAKLLMQLMADKIRLESDLFVVSRSMTKNAPTVQNLSSRIEVVELQITKLKARLTGSSTDERNVAASLARFEELEVQRQFAERLYTMAQDGLERARMTAERQTVYLTVFVPPAMPEDSTFPRRTANAFLIPLALFILWSIVALTWASVEDHRA
ncbi:MAG: capsule biosynthesis protein [Alphaproteobacteria bacterium]|nr:capsule biosynthesis protein [Alphaproteobacteria bacterium]